MWYEDEHARFELAGYGTCFLPVAPGAHDVDVACWRPYGSPGERLAAAFVGGYPQLADPTVIASDNDRYGLQTETTGLVYFHLDVISSTAFAPLGVRLRS